jgi:hypothetical protein
MADGLRPPGLVLNLVKNGLLGEVRSEPGMLPYPRLQKPFFMKSPTN